MYYLSFVRLLSEIYQLTPKLWNSQITRTIYQGHTYMHVKFRQLQRCFGLYFEKVQITFNYVVKYGHLHSLKFAIILIVL